MAIDSRSSLRQAAAVLLVAAAATLHPAEARQATPAGQRSAPTFRSSIDLVTINVVVRDKDGNIVRGLTRDDFTVTEDGKPQSISTFDFEEITRQPLDAMPETMPTVLGGIGRAGDGRGRRHPAAAPIDMHGRRLIAMLFDLSSMQPEEA